MTSYTQLTELNVLQVLTPFGVTTVESFKLLSGGSENTNYWVKTDRQELVLTICEQKSLSEAQELASLLDYLQRNNFSSSIVLKNVEGQAISVWLNKPVMVKAFIDGEVLEHFSDPLLEYLGTELAKLHQLKAPDYLPKILNYGIEKFDEVKVYAENSDFDLWLEDIKVYIESFITSDLTKSLIHSDIFNSNIIVSQSGDLATIMDFEEASYYYRIFDIGMMIVGTCSDAGIPSLKKAKCLLSGYCQSIELSNNELNALQAFTVYGAAATAFWRHHNYNFVNPNPEMKDHYLAMKNFADTIRGIPSEQFKHQIGLEET